MDINQQLSRSAAGTKFLFSAKKEFRSSFKDSQLAQPANGNYNSALSKTAQNIEFSTAGVPQTRNGKLACMWALNHVVKAATGRPILADSRGRYALSTITVAKELRSNPQLYRPVTLEKIRAGDICVAATSYISGRVSHRGHGYVVGSKNSLGEHQAWHNSSSQARWRQYGTIEGYAAKRHGEQLLCYRLIR